VESSAAGLAALALFVLVLGYWVPQRVRHRQQLLDTRLEDRFSEGLRVLAVAARGPVPAVAGPALTAVDENVGLLTMSGEHTSGERISGGHQPIKVPVPVRDSSTSGASGAPSSSRPASRPAGRRAREETPMAPQPAGAHSRIALLEERVRRARRRLRLTLALLVLSVAVWALVLGTSLAWFVGVLPTALLVVVLGLGRAAAASARRADSRWAAERRTAERQALHARALAAGGPRAPVNRARVTGRAVHGPSTATQMIPQVSIRVVDGVAEAVPATARSQDVSSTTPVVEPAAEPTTPADASAGRTSSAGASAGRTASADALAGPTAPAPESAGPTTLAPAPARPTSSYAPGAAAKAAARPAPSTAAIPSQQTWEARPVPLPTYVTKPAAPRREPRPLTGTTPVPAGTPNSTGWSTTPWQRVGDAGEQGGEADTSWSLWATQDAVLGEIATPAPASAASASAASAASASVGPADGESFDPLVAEDPRPRTETLGLPLEQILARRRAAG